jgi:hypothetical protein
LGESDLILKAIAAELHRFDGIPNWDHPIRVRFEFDGGTAIRMCGTPDGEGVTFDSLPLEAPFDMGEYGAVERANASQRFAPALIGAEVALRPIANPDGRQIGIAIVYEGEPAFCVLNLGDDLYWGDWKKFECWEDVGSVLAEPLTPGR